MENATASEQSHAGCEGAAAGTADGPFVPSIHYARVVRAVANAARAAGLEVPVFRSPPRSGHLDRSVGFRADGTCVVAVRLADRPESAVEADVIDAVLYANDLFGADAVSIRRVLWGAVSKCAGLHGAAPGDARPPLKAQEPVAA